VFIREFVPFIFMRPGLMVAEKSYGRKTGPKKCAFVDFRYKCSNFDTKTESVHFANMRVLYRPRLGRIVHNVYIFKKCNINTLSLILI
jgi:hypothetical protein